MKKHIKKESVFCYIFVGVMALTCILPMWITFAASISREYGISRYAIQEWLRQEVLPKSRGRKAAKTLQEYKYENKRLKMEVELLRDFLQHTERR